MDKQEYRMKLYYDIFSREINMHGQSRAHQKACCAVEHFDEFFQTPGKAEEIEELERAINQVLDKIRWNALEGLGCDLILKYH